MTADSRMREILAASCDSSALHKEMVLSGHPTVITVSEALEAMRRIAKEAREAGIEEAADICRKNWKEFLDSKYATGQPLSSFSERFACETCEREIRALIHKDQT